MNLLCVDVEGSEWFVIKYMISRPAIISLETHGAIYVNPYIDRILDWMNTNNYRVWCKTNSDTVFVKKDEIEISILDKLGLAFRNMYIFWRRFRKKLKKQLKSIFYKNQS